MARSSGPATGSCCPARPAGRPGRPLRRRRRYLRGVRCPWCGAAEDRVVDSREAEQGEAVRRRRECATCGRRFTTYERATRSVLWVVKRSGQRVPFERAKVEAGVAAACKNRPVDKPEIEELAADVEDAMRALGPQVTSEQVGLAVLEQLRRIDEVASVRFASVYKGFEHAGDFARELGLLESTGAGGSRPVPASPHGLEKQTAPKQRRVPANEPAAAPAGGASPPER